MGLCVSGFLIVLVRGHRGYFFPESIFFSMSLISDSVSAKTSSQKLNSFFDISLRIAPSWLPA